MTTDAHRRAERSTPRPLMRFVSPVVYGIALTPAVALTVAVGSLLAGFVGRGALWYALLVVAGILVGAAVYYGIGRFLIAAERLRQRGLRDRFRRCVLLYVVLVITLLWGVSTFVSTGGVGWPTFATEMQLHILSVVLAALAVDKLVASNLAGKPTGGNR
ncbi:MAG: hypothetical protein ACR2KW_12355 [Rubrobacter sp.]